MAEATVAGRSVLVVEDEFYLADDIDRALKVAGATVLGPVPSVEAALDLLTRQPAPEIAVLDVNLGSEMVYPVADSLAMRGIPFVYATGYDDTAIPDRYDAAPRLQKPIEPQQIVDALSKIFAVAR